MTEALKKNSVDFKKLRFVEVRWLDASVTNSWTSIHDDSLGASSCISRGWVMRQEATQILLCGTVGLGDNGLVEDANAIISIPSPMIQSITDFPPKARKRRHSLEKKEETKNESL